MLPPNINLATYYDHPAYTPLASPGLLRRGVRWFRSVARYIVVRFFLRSKGRLILDIGCARGDFLLFMLARGFAVHGTETDKAAFTHCRSRGIAMHEGADLSIIPDATFDVVTMIHVLEHILDIHHAMHHIYRILKPGGICLITVPNFDAAERTFYGKHWFGYEVPRHLSHFTRVSLTTLVTCHHLRPVCVLPAPLDTLDICMQSEKSRNGWRILGMLLGIVGVFRSAVFPPRASTITMVVRKETSS